jgi:hypothetical protein
MLQPVNARPSAPLTAAPTLKLGQGAGAYSRAHWAVSISSFKGIVLFASAT